MTKYEKQALLVKHAKNFIITDKKDHRETFRGIRYAANCNAYVSDNHTMLRIKDVSPYSEAHLIHAIDGTEIEGTYPSDTSLEDVVNVELGNYTVIDSTFRIHELASAAKVLSMAAKEFKEVMVDIVHESELILRITLPTGKLEFNLGLPEHVLDETITLNAVYLSNTFNVFKDARSTSIKIKFGSKVQPVVFSDEDSGIDVLILPIRRG